MPDQLNRIAATCHTIARSRRFGPAAIVWAVVLKRPKVVRVFVSKPGLTARDRVKMQFPDSTRSSCAEIEALAHDMEAFLNGSDIDFSLDMALLRVCSQFQQSVLRVEHTVPRGEVTTYQRIAERIGRPKGARAVGNALARNPFPIIVPCHRAIRSDRTLGGYQGGPAMKRALLEAEGILFDTHTRPLP